MRAPRHLALIVVAGLAASTNALAQTAECQRYRAELASISRSSGLEAAAQRQRQDIARLSSYYHSIGCNSGGFLFFGPPPECGAIAQRINALQASYGRIASQAHGYSDARRRQLAGLVRQACSSEHARRDEDDESSSRRLGGGKLVCVRACDGFAFPLSTLPKGGRSDADQMCQALCPGAEAAAYSMPSGGDAELAQAVSMRGKPYTKLASAFKFQKSFDPSCSCRKEGQTWAEALQKAETMIARRGDVIVTAKKAEELSQPKLVRRSKSKPAETQTAAKPLDVETTGSITPAKTDAGEGAELAKATSPDAAEGEKIAGEREGEDGAAKRKVRIVGPAFISLQQAASE